MTRRLIPFAVLLSVTALLALYGSTTWAWLGGPVVATAIWLLDRRADAPVAPAPARRAIRREPTPVD